jgi:hypothetical protein
MAACRAGRSILISDAARHRPPGQMTPLKEFAEMSDEERPPRPPPP